MSRDVARIVDGAQQLRVTQQYRTQPAYGVVVTVEQRTTGGGRSVLLAPDRVRELRDALTAWLDAQEVVS